ncbi:hypothetical protein HK102_012780, partial [Quaeritorhiza haematococci]
MHFPSGKDGSSTTATVKRVTFKPDHEALHSSETGLYFLQARRSEYSGFLFCYDEGGDPFNEWQELYVRRGRGQGAPSATVGTTTTNATSTVELKRVYKRSYPDTLGVRKVVCCGDLLANFVEYGTAIALWRIRGTSYDVPNANSDTQSDDATVDTTPPTPEHKKPVELLWLVSHTDDLSDSLAMNEQFVAHCDGPCIFIRRNTDGSIFRTATLVSDSEVLGGLHYSEKKLVMG